MKQDHIFFDLETSSLDPIKGEIIDIAAIRTDSLGNVLCACTNKVKPTKDVEASAAAVNGYNERDWKNAIPLQTAIDAINSTIMKDRTDKYAVVAYNAEFDKAFLTESCKRLDIEFPFPKRAWVDPMHMAWILVYGDNIESRKLTSLANYYGVDIKDAHTAVGDCEIMMEVYFRMMQRFAIGQKVEKIGRNLVSEATGKIVNMVQNIGRSQS